MTIVNRIARAGLAVAALAAAALPASAAENGIGWYLLGLRGPGAAVAPPVDGIFIQNDIYHFTGAAKKEKNLPLGAYVGAGIEGSVTADMLTVLWMTPARILDGRLGVSLTQPWGGPTISASATAVPPFGLRQPLSVGAKDTGSFFGDPVLTGFLAWQSGNWYLQTGTSVNVPVGQYDSVGFANMSFHRWAVDPFVAVTWRDPGTGIDVSTAVGYTFNGTNNATDYHTGDEFHIEAALSKAITKEFSAGILGYYYEQTTADSGSGATLGAFRGRAVALGGTIGYDFALNGIPISTRIKVFHEFETRNRLANGTSAFLTLSMPVWVPNPPTTVK